MKKIIVLLSVLVLLTACQKGTENIESTVSTDTKDSLTQTTKNNSVSFDTVDSFLAIPNDSLVGSYVAPQDSGIDFVNTFESGYTDSDYVISFEDRGVEAKVRTLLHKPQDAVIFKSEVNPIVGLDLRFIEPPVQTITDLQHFTHLRRLILSHTDVALLDSLVYTQHLEYINISNTPVTDVFALLTLPNLVCVEHADTTISKDQLAQFTPFLDYFTETVSVYKANSDALPKIGGKTALETLIRLVESEQSQTALLLATRLNWSRAVEALINGGSSVHVTDPSGKTALMYAAQYTPTPHIAQLLLMNGVDSYQTDMFNKTALDYAIENNNVSLRKLLESIQG